VRYFARRLMFLVGTLWVAVTVNFLIPRLMPGSPVEAMMARFHAQGNLTAATMKAIALMLGLSHGSLWQQYAQYLGQVVRFNFGVSYAYFPYSVSYMIGHALPWTLGLVGISTILSFCLGTVLGIVAASRRGRAADSLLTSISAFTSTFPYFWFGLACLYVLSFLLNWFPLSGAYDLGQSPTASWAFVGAVIHHSILPAITIVISSVGGWLLSMRNNMINTLNEDYVLLAQAKGLKERWISWMYVARNALLPNLTGFAIAIGFVVSGSLLTEIVFAYPGLGYLLYNAVINEDFPLMQGLFLIIVVCVVVANFIADLAYVLFDPRVRRGSAQ
jgi:peptide/nickel transport system permease protein